MAAGDAAPVPIRGQAFRVTFACFATTGKLAPGVTLLSTVSLDGASASYGSRPTEISANTGLYFLDLTAAQMAAQTIAITATPLTAQTTVLTTPIVLYPQGPTAAFYADVRSMWATTADALAVTTANSVWGTTTRTLTSLENVKAGIVSSVWATPGRSIDGDVTGSVGSVVGDVEGNVNGDVEGNVLGDVTGLLTISQTAAATISGAVWASPTRTLTSGGGSVDADAIAASVWASSSRTLSTLAALLPSITNSVWATSTRTLTSLAALLPDITNSVWATSTRTLTSLDNVKAPLVSAVWATPTRTITGGTIDTVNTGGISATSFAAGAIDAAALASNAIGDSELSSAATGKIADGLLGRGVQGGSDGGRTVSQAFYVLRNRVQITGATTVSVFATDDNTISFSATLATDSQATRITGIDPTS